MAVSGAESKAQLAVYNYRSAPSKNSESPTSTDNLTTADLTSHITVPSNSATYPDKMFRRPQTDKHSLFDPDDDDAAKPSEEGTFHWKPALIQSGIFLGIQHAFRMTQPKTTQRLGGKFFKEWGESIRGIRGWKDSDSGFTNYVAHPLQGSVTGHIFVNNSDKAAKQVFGTSKDYWMSRLKAMAWSAVWSVQFEIGPISEASLGNVGSFKKYGISTGAYVDLVVTPTIGTGVLIAEDAIDKYVLTNWIERNAGGRATAKVKILRSLLTPTASFANVLRWKVPWKRDSRAN